MRNESARVTIAQVNVTNVEREVWPKTVFDFRLKLYQWSVDVTLIPPIDEDPQLHAAIIGWVDDEEGCRAEYRHLVRRRSRGQASSRH